MYECAPDLTADFFDKMFVNFVTTLMFVKCLYCECEQRKLILVLLV